MKNSYKLLTILLFTAHYTMMHASAYDEDMRTYLRNEQSIQKTSANTTEQPAAKTSATQKFSAHDQLEQYKKECMLSYISYSKESFKIIDQIALKTKSNLEISKSHLRSMINLDFETLESHPEMEPEIFLTIDIMKCVLNKTVEDGYATKISKIQEMQIKEAQLQNLRKSSSRSRSNSY
jgi:hypothetical protein